MPEPVLKDQAARDRIAGDLDTNMMVLAGAGAGKTHELIERIAATVTSGRCDIDRLAAITFTRKAAGEMRGRLFVKLRKQADESGAEQGSPGLAERCPTRAPQLAPNRWSGARAVGAGGATRKWPRRAPGWRVGEGHATGGRHTGAGAGAGGCGRSRRAPW